MSSMIKKALLGLCLSVGLSTAHATITDLGNTTHDTSSGLTWLDLTATNGLSYQEVSSEFGAGGLFEGYRYAEMAEVGNFYQNYLNAGGILPDFMDMIGVTSYWPVPARDYYEWHSIGLVGDSDPWGIQSTYGNYWYSSGVYGEDPVFGTIADWYAPNEATEGVASFLVTSAVPAPAALPMALLGLGMIGVAYRRRKLAAKAEG